MDTGKTVMVALACLYLGTIEGVVHILGRAKGALERLAQGVL